MTIGYSRVNVRAHRKPSRIVRSAQNREIGSNYYCNTPRPTERARQMRDGNGSVSEVRVPVLKNLIFTGFGTGI